MKIATAILIALAAVAASAQTTPPRLSLWPNGAPGSESRRPARLADWLNDRGLLK
jgi:hypothetical protein